MTSEVLDKVWPLLGVLAYLLVTCVLTVLTSIRKRALDVHDRVRECHELRRRYMSQRDTKPAE